MTLRSLRQILKALADDTRLRIINIIFKKERTVKDICRILKVSQPAVSKHLMRLRLLRIVIDRRQGNSIYYRVNFDSDQGRIIRLIFAHFSSLDAFRKDHARSKVG